MSAASTEKLPVDITYPVIALSTEYSSRIPTTILSYRVGKLHQIDLRYGTFEREDSGFKIDEDIYWSLEYKSLCEGGWFWSLGFFKEDIKERTGIARRFEGTTNFGQDQRQIDYFGLMGSAGSQYHYQVFPHLYFLWGWSVGYQHSITTANEKIEPWTLSSSAVQNDFVAQAESADDGIDRFIFRLSIGIGF